MNKQSKNKEIVKEYCHYCDRQRGVFKTIINMPKKKFYYYKCLTCKNRWEVDICEDGK